MYASLMNPSIKSVASFIFTASIVGSVVYWLLSGTDMPGSAVELVWVSVCLIGGGIVSHKNRIVRMR